MDVFAVAQSQHHGAFARTPGRVARAGGRRHGAFARGEADHDPVGRVGGGLGSRRRVHRQRGPEGEAGAEHHRPRAWAPPLRARSAVRCAGGGEEGGEGHAVSDNDDVPAAAASRTPRPMTMSERFFPRDDYFMRLALREAELALEHDDVPIGAVVVREGEVLAAAHNERELRQDPTAHAEVLALREAARHDETWRILDAVLYVTLEPCAMCAGALVLARLPRVVYGATDPKAGACGSVLDVLV